MTRKPQQTLLSMVSHGHAITLSPLKPLWWSFAEDEDQAGGAAAAGAEAPEQGTVHASHLLHPLPPCSATPACFTPLTGQTHVQILSG